MTDLDELIDETNLRQRMALAQCLAALMQADSARKQATQKPGDVAFTRPVARDGMEG